MILFKNKKQLHLSVTQLLTIV